jgi:hypothetical protein
MIGITVDNYYKSYSIVDNHKWVQVLCIIWMVDNNKYENVYRIPLVLKKLLFINITMIKEQENVEELVDFIFVEVFYYYHTLNQQLNYTCRTRKHKLLYKCHWCMWLKKYPRL